MTILFLIYLIKIDLVFDPFHKNVINQKGRWTSFYVYQKCYFVTTKFINCSPYLAFATGSGTINVHIFGISGTFLVLFPFIAKGLVVGTCIITFLASHRTIFQHPPGIFLAFIIAHCCPRGAISKNKQKNNAYLIYLYIIVRGNPK